MNIEKIKLLADDIDTLENVNICRVGESVYLVNDTESVGPYAFYTNMCKGLLHRGVRNNTLEYVITTPKGITVFSTDLQNSDNSVNKAFSNVVHDIVKAIVSEYGVKRYNNVNPKDGVTQINFEEIKYRPGRYVVKAAGTLDGQMLGVIDDNKKDWILKGYFTAIDIQDNFIKTIKFEDKIKCRLYDFKGTDILGREFNKIDYVDDNLFLVSTGDKISCLLKITDGKSVILTDSKYIMSMKKGDLIILYYKNKRIVDDAYYLCDIYSIKEEKILNKHCIVDITVEKDIIIANCLEVLHNGNKKYFVETFKKFEED